MRLRSGQGSSTQLRDDPRLPNLFVLGAPRAGTTFLHHALGLAPSVYMSRVKETGFFVLEREVRRGLDYYLDAFFPDAAGHAVRGESTPWYLYSDLALEQIAKLPSPQPPRFVVTVRRPAARARSMYGDAVRMNRENRTFDEAVRAELDGLAAGDLVPDVRARYVWGSLYSPHIERWRVAFGDDRVHVILLEEMMQDAAGVWHDLATFLGHDLGSQRFDAVPELERNSSGSLRWPRLDAVLRSFEGRDHAMIEFAKRVLPPGVHRRALQRIGRMNRVADRDAQTPTSPETMDMLDEYFGPEVERMERLLGRSLPLWRSSAAEADAPAVTSTGRLDR
jgi:hypothetical protein